MPSPKRKPNHDAAGNNYSGSPINYDARTGDRVYVHGLVWRVSSSYNHGIEMQRGRRKAQITYRELLRLNATYAEVK